MIVEMQCPECNALLRVNEELAGKQAKCPQCGKFITVLVQTPQPTPSSSVPLSQASPDEIVNEFSTRGRSAVLVLFETPDSDEYELHTLANAKIRIYSTTDMDDAKKLRALTNIGRIAAGVDQARTDSSSILTPQAAFELKGDPLGMSLSDFKKKYARKTSGVGLPLPWCSSDSPGQPIEALLVERWHSQCGIIHARVDLPAEKSSPTVAGVSTDLLLYQFLDERLFRITAFFDTESFHVVRAAITNKHGQPSSETVDPVQFTWESGISSIHLIRGQVRPKQASLLHYVHNPLLKQMEQRTPDHGDDL